MARKGRVDYPRDLGPCGEPFSEAQTRCHMPLKPHGERAYAAQYEIDIIRRDALADGAMPVQRRLPCFFGGGDGAHHHIRVAAEIFRHRLNGDIRTMLERPEVA